MQSLKAKVKDVISADSGSNINGFKKTILVTGGSGYLAAHVLNSFMSRGYNVRATVRSENSVEKVKQTHSQYADLLSFAIVKDITTPGAFDEAVKEVDGVIHMASPFVMEGIKDNIKELLLPATKGTTGILEAIQKNNPSIKRVVITSSFASMWDGSKGTWPEHSYTEADWNPVTWEEAANPETNGAIAYCASKTFAERAAWDFINEKKPGFTLATILPPMVYGPAAHEPPDLEKLNTSSAEIYNICNGSKTEVPETGFYAFVDVRDVAEAHLKAYETPNPGRFFVTGGNYTFQQVCDIIRMDFPERRHLTPEGIAGAELPKVYKLDNGKAKRELELTFRDLQTTIHDMVVEFERIEKQGGV